MEIIFWQNIISPHQSPFIRALSLAGHEVTYVAVEAMSKERSVMGWGTPDLGRTRIVLNPTHSQIRCLVERSSPEAIHVIAGARWNSMGKIATRSCFALNRRLGIMSEAPDQRGGMGMLRFLKYNAERIFFGRDFDFVLAIGESGVHWFRRCGYTPGRLFPFCYVTENATVKSASPSGHVKILYVGRLIPIKGVDLLLRAFSLVKTLGARLVLLGDGPEIGQLRRLATELRIDDAVDWLGSKENSEVASIMASADLMVLPSYKDGWGAVVNEALTVGTPVLVSDACGAADLLQNPLLGSVFTTGSLESLAGELQSWISRGSLTSQQRKQIMAWSNCIGGDVVAQYLENIFEHVYKKAVRPVPPWRKTGQILEFIFWQNIISPHQAPFIRALSLAGHEVTYVTAEIMTADRSDLGWEVPDLGKARLVIAPTRNDVLHLVKGSSAESVHVFAGARWKTLGRQAMRFCKQYYRRVGIMSEAADPRGLLGLLRRLKYVSERMQKGRRVGFILGMGEMGINWFRKSGYSEDILFPFCYTTGIPSEAKLSPSSNHFRILFVGQFVRRKQINLLLRAFALAQPLGARLCLLGKGSEEGRLRRLAVKLGIASSVDWLGMVANQDISGVMASCDLLVLPSYHDGWGAVVNEALMVGTPAICSDVCGAVELLQDPLIGEAFPSGEVSALADILRKRVGWGKVTLETRERIRAQAAAIEGKRVAQYLVDIARHIYYQKPRPVAPWRQFGGECPNEVG